MASNMPPEAHGRARDTKLGPNGLARFTARNDAVAALNHPHIVTIFSTEEADSVRFMTMELVEGRTLEQLTPRGGVSLAQFFDIAVG